MTQVQVEETAAMERQEQHTRTIPPEELARVDISGAKATLVKQQLDEWALAQAQMRRDEKEKPVDVCVMDAETSLLSRNPFRRQQEVTKTSKPLMPISTVKVPILTPQIRKATLAREEMEGGLNLKRKRIAAEVQEQREELDEADLKIKPGPRPKTVTSSTKETTGSREFNWKAWSKNAS